MLAKMQCLCSGGKNKVNMRDHGPWFIIYGYEMDDCTLLVLEPKEKLFILILTLGEVIHHLYLIIQSCLIFQ